jgi:hypothetical protein
MSGMPANIQVDRLASVQVLKRPNLFVTTQV